MFRNDYGGAIAQWKLDLILARARRLGFRRHDLEDVQQELVVTVLRFSFDPAKSNGATELTVLTAVIDNKLLAIRRAKLRYAKRFAELGDEELTLEDSFSTESLEQAADVQRAVVSLPPPGQGICSALAEGRSVNDIARSEGTSWHTVRRQIDGIRRRFERVGLAK